MSNQLESPKTPTASPQRFRTPAARPASTPNPLQPASPPPQNHQPDDEEGFLARHGKKLLVAGILLLAAGMYFAPKSGPTAPPRKTEKVVSVQLPPPPPPPKVIPPPPPKVQPPPEKMEKQAPVAEDKPKEAQKKAESPPPTALATGIKGDGPGSGLSSSGNGLGGGGNLIGGGQGGNTGGKWDRYAGQVQTKIADALRQNPQTKAAKITNLQVRIWPDSTGKITRASLANSTGDLALDQAIERQVLNGLQLAEAPPAGMKLPITLRLSAKRPN